MSSSSQIRTEAILVDGKPTLAKRCADCGKLKMVSASSRESEFYVRWRPLADGRLSPGWGRLCKRCRNRQARVQYYADVDKSRELGRARYWRLRKDAEWLATDRVRRAEAARRRRADMTAAQSAAYRKRRRELRRVWRARKLAEDPAYFTVEAKRERSRRAQAVRDERERTRRRRAGRRRLVSSEPFRRWLVEQMGFYGIEDGAELACQLEVEPRRVTAVLAREPRQARISYDIVDRAVLNGELVEVNLGDRSRLVVSVDDLYPGAML